MSIKITIRECKTNGQVWSSVCRTDEVDIAIRRTIAKHWSPKHGFYIDRGLTTNPDTTRYGQIGYAVRGANVANMSTGRVRVDIEEV